MSVIRVLYMPIFVTVVLTVSAIVLYFVGRYLKW